jgi:hypothetical protein
MKICNLSCLSLQNNKHLIFKEIFQIINFWASKAYSEYIYVLPN